MNIFSSLILGAIQGFTEFLPISSSAHLVIAQHFLPEFSQPGVFFDVVLHMGTLLAVVWYFRHKIVKIEGREAVLLILASIPAALAGFLFEKQFESMFSDIVSVGIQLLISGVLCFLIDRATSARKEITAIDSIWIGVAQAIAIIPGISRSGATIFAGVASGVSKERVAEFSFLLSIPAIAGALLLQLVSHRSEIFEINALFYLAGLVTSFLFGILSIAFLLNWLTSKKLKYFGIYCVIVGLLIMKFG